MHPEMLVRENNIAKHAETLKSLGLNKSFEEAMGLPPKRKSAGKGSSGRKTKCARAEIEGDSDHKDGEDGEDDKDDNDNEEPPLLHTPRPQHGKVDMPCPAPKEWACKAKDALEVAEFGVVWAGLVKQWYLHEEGKGFVAPVSF
jgi:hypothetical protein